MEDPSERLYQALQVDDVQHLAEIVAAGNAQNWVAHGDVVERGMFTNPHRAYGEALREGKPDFALRLLELASDMITIGHDDLEYAVQWRSVALTRRLLGSQRALSGHLFRLACQDLDQAEESQCKIVDLLLDVNYQLDDLHISDVLQYAGGQVTWLWWLIYRRPQLWEQTRVPVVYQRMTATVEATLVEATTRNLATYLMAAV